jgi:hypothetical protein
VPSGSFVGGVLVRGGVVQARICKGRCSKKAEVGEGDRKVSFHGATVFERRKPGII